MGKGISEPGRGPRSWESRRTLLLAVLGLCVLGAFLRLYRLDELMVFSGDQGRDVTIVQRMIETGQPALLGPGSGAGQFKRGPAYYYLLLPALLVSGGEPFSGIVFVVFANIVAIALVYVLGRALVSPTAGIVSAALFAVGLVPVVVSRAFTNPALLPCLTLLMVYALWRMIRGDDRFLPVLVGTWVVAWQLHDQVLLLVPFFVVAWIWFKIHVRSRMIGLALAVSLVLLAPFLYYEAAHDAANLRAMLDYVRAAGAERAGQVGISGGSQRIGETLWVLGRAFAEPVALRVLWSAAVAASALVLLIRVRTESQGAQLLFLYAVLPFLYALWPGPIYEVNVAIVTPVPFLLCGYGLEQLTRRTPQFRTVGLVLVALVCALNVGLQFDSLRTRSLAADSYLTVHLVIAEMLKRSAGRPFVLDYIVETQNEEFASPFHYLLNRYRAPMTTDPMAMRLRVYNPALLGEPGSGTLVHGLRVVPFSAPQAVGENLLNKPWNLPAQPARSGHDVSVGEIVLESDSIAQTITAVQRAAIEPNTLYLLQFECRNGLTRGDQRLYVSALDLAGNTVETYPTGAGYTCPASDDWTPGAVLFQSPAETVRARVLLQNRGEGIVLFRSVRLHRAIQEPLPLKRIFHEHWN